MIIIKENKVLFIGLSNKIGCTPLQSNTITGDLIDKIIIGVKAKCFKANLVHFAPLNDKGKLRYPTKSEMDIGYEVLQELIKEIKPDICILLGNKVSKYLSEKVNSISIIHPSYIAVYKKNYINKYVEDTINIINSVINEM